MRTQHLAILCDNKPGVLTHIAGLISRKAINIESLTAGYTEERNVTRFNIVISIEDDKELKQTMSQLAKLIDIIKIVNLDEEPFISYELAMIKVRYDSPRAREELSGLAGLFHAKVVDVNLNSLILRVTGREDHVDALIKVLSPYDVLEIVRTGTISLSRGPVPVKEMESTAGLCRAGCTGQMQTELPPMSLSAQGWQLRLSGLFCFLLSY